jgi:hypothetical protein
VAKAIEPTVTLQCPECKTEYAEIAEVQSHDLNCSFCFLDKVEIVKLVRKN